MDMSKSEVERLLNPIAAQDGKEREHVKENFDNKMVLDNIGKEEMHWLTLCFRTPEIETKYIGDAAHQRRPVLMCVLFFDIVCFIFRMAAYGVGHGRYGFLGRVTSIMPQILNMLMLHTVVAWANRRSRRSVAGESKTLVQEEALLAVAMALAISFLLATLSPKTSQDYVFACMFLICTSTFLKIRWLMGTAILAFPLVVMNFTQNLPEDGRVHIVVAWSVGGLMSYLADSYRREMFANQLLARVAAEKEIHEAKARTLAQSALADAQAQAAARALTVAKEKAANEAKSEFMSLMCHEVRTPLNGCLASAEMLLDTKLEEDQRELAKTIRVSGSILLSTVSNFLDFFKTEAGKALDVVSTEVEVQELVNDVHCIIDAMIGRSNEVILMKPQLIDVPQYLMGDSDRLRGILLNLYTNAAKFTRRGAICLKVSVHGANYRPQPVENAALHEAVEDFKQHQSEEKASLGLSLQNEEEFANSSNNLASASDLKPPIPNIHTNGSSSPQRKSIGNESNGTNLRGKDASVSDSSLDNSFSNGMSTSSDGTITSTQSEPTLNVTPFAGATLPPKRNSDQLEIERSKAATFFARRSALAKSREFQEDLVSIDGASSNIIDQADGWAQIVSSRSGETSTSRQGRSSFDREKSKWVFFEVADTGVGIGPKGLKALFREFVQAPEDEMKKPRSRGGTGLGLSICSKQVGFLGGKVGVLSKPGAGSTFWFCVPLKLPDPSALDKGIEFRRTASWGSRDAFTDGHLTHHAESSSTRSHKRPSTAKAHAFRKYHPTNKSHAIHSSMENAKGRTARSGSDTSLLAAGIEHRRHSAPELTRQWKEITKSLNGVTKKQHINRVRHVQKLMQPNVVHNSELRPSPETGTSAANFAAAKALLVEGDQGKLSEENLNFARDDARASQDLRLSMNSNPEAKSTSLSLLEQGNGKHANRPGLLLNRHTRNKAVVRPSLEQVREAALEMDKIAARKRMSSDQRSLPSRSQSGVSDHGNGLMLRKQLMNYTGQSRPSAEHTSRTEPSNTNIDSEFGSTRLSQDRGSASVLASTADNSRPQAQATVPEDREMSNDSLATPMIVSKSEVQGGRRLVGRGQLRPSMEARWRKLDVSALQGRKVLLAEDNLINQKVAQMMLTNLGMVVEVANNGQEAVQLVLKAEEAKNQFHCVLMDMAMPIMGGVKATLALRRDGISVPIVAMTANASDRDRDECLSAGMDGFLSKPVLKDRLAEAIMLVTSGRARYNADALVSLKPYNQL